MCVSALVLPKAVHRHTMAAISQRQNAGKRSGIAAHDDHKKMGIYKKRKISGHFVAYKNFIESAGQSVKTPSGKIRNLLEPTPLTHRQYTGAGGKATRDKPTADFIPLLLKDGTIETGTFRYSCLAFTINPVPIQEATAILMFYRPPVAGGVDKSA